MPPLVLDGTNGVSGVDGTASNPAIEGTDSNTGIFYPAADTVAIGTGGTEALRVNSSQNVGIGTSSPSAVLDVSKASFTGGPLVGARFNTSNFRMGIGIGNTNGFPFLGVNVNNAANDNGTFDINGYASRLRLDNGIFQVQTSSASGTAGGAITWTTPLTLDASGNLSVGTTAVNARLTLNTLEAKTVSALVANFGTSTGGSSDFQLLLSRSASGSGAYYSLQSVEQNVAVRDIVLQPSGGNVLLAKTAADATSVGWNLNSGTSSQVVTISSGTNEAFIYNNTSTGGNARVDFRVANVSKGNIQWNNTNTAYNTTSDYRLKENIAPMTGALAKVSALKPVTYKWKADGSEGEGFIAHELAEVVPQCVTGEKDAVDSEGNPQYQGIDTSFLVATLTAAIQELNAKVEAFEAQLKGNA